MKIIGRQNELNVLQSVYKSNKAEFVAIYGRRRVGKTFLVSQYFQNKGIYFEITGSQMASVQEQLKNYHREFLALFDSECYTTEPESWSDALYRLYETINALDSKHKIILFFDELPWLATPRSGFMAALEYIWNRHLSRNPNVKLIICGSAAAWMIKHVIHNKGGLYGRLSRIMPLAPFTLSEVESYFSAEGIHLDRKQIIEIYMVTGGIGKYLSYVHQGLSAAQVINGLCFQPSAPLLLEFTKLFQSLFDNSSHHVNIVKTLAQKHYGMRQDDLLKAVDLVQSGHASTILSELEECGFILTIPMFGKQVKDRVYRLVDEYCSFYLNWIAPRRSSILLGSDHDYWLKVQSSPSWHNWAGYAFENICLKHSLQIKQALGLAAVSTTESHWFKKEQLGGERTGTQIDLVIDRADGCINLCEIKFCKSEFVINKHYADILERKQRIFQESTGTKKTLFTTLITPYGTKENEHYRRVVHSQLTLEALF